MSDQIDPQSSSSLALGRGAFIGLSTGVAVAGVDAARTLAAGMQLGQPHPPFVAEDDPAITVERPQLPVLNDTLQSYAAYPKTKSAAVPGIVLIPHIWGIDAQIR